MLNSACVPVPVFREEDQPSWVDGPGFLNGNEIHGAHDMFTICLCISVDLDGYRAQPKSLRYVYDMFAMFHDMFVH